MRRLLALLGGLGGAALLRAWLRRPGREPQPPAAPAEPSDPRADELRRKLEESRTLVDEREEFEGGETPVDRADAAAPPDERRRDVHERGRATLDEMRRESPPDET